MSKTQQPNKGGRPKVDTEAISLRLLASVIREIDDYRRIQADLPNRQEAVRRLLRAALDAEKQKKS